MFTNLNEKHAHLLSDKSKSYAFLATTMADGSPQLTPVWFNMDGDILQINTASGRTKDRNMKARPDVSIVLMKMNDPGTFLQLKGKVESYTRKNADAHINDLSQKYGGVDWSTSTGEIRVKYRIKITKIIGY
jgi:PPOX class probable F420-dependent enzyme